MTTRLKLLCHASTAAVRNARFPADEELDDHARRVLPGLAHNLHRADRCFTSPGLRAKQTAEALNLGRKIEPLLRECDYGRWAGRSLADVQAEEPEIPCPMAAGARRRAPRRRIPAGFARAGGAMARCAERRARPDRRRHPCLRDSRRLCFTRSRRGRARSGGSTWRLCRWRASTATGGRWTLASIGPTGPGNDATPEAPPRQGPEGRLRSLILLGAPLSPACAHHLGIAHEGPAQRTSNTGEGTRRSPT